MRSAGCSCAEGGDSLVSGSTDIGTTPFRRPGSVYWRQGLAFLPVRMNTSALVITGLGSGVTLEKKYAAW